MTKKNRIYLFLIFLLGAGIFGYEMTKVSWADLHYEFTHLNLFWFLIAISCMFFYWGLEARIIQLLAKREKPDFSYRSAFRIPLIEQLFNSITPFSTGGQPAQLVALTQAGLDAGVSGSICLMKFVLYQMMIVFNFLICVVFGFTIVKAHLHKLAWLVLIGFLLHLVVVLVLLLVMFGYRFTNQMVQWFLVLVRKFAGEERSIQLGKVIFEKMTNFHRESNYMRSQKKLMFKASILTFFQLLFFYAVPYFIFLSLNITKVSLWYVMILHAFIILIISLFPIPGGSGGAEYTFRLLFAGSLINRKLVLALLLWRFVTFYLGIFTGIGALAIKPKKSKA